MLDSGQTYWTLSLTKYCNFYQVNVGLPQYNLPSARQVWAYRNILSQPGHPHNGRITLKKNGKLAMKEKMIQAFLAFPFQFPSWCFDKGTL